ncbi:ABC transporter substrate-binding protein [Bosea thiooxidans]|uniref:ABC transporter substrate-binding protein n=1 Tax=Bosea thiooxidans TaxID=53254 RepID=A0A0Q3I3L1_9HYPH|nr:TRAP transporter substrate-binding protein [Bosea thiooxidans]KQK29440.1 ABC transporter substrate-binding protein [Bosea thiooxidans]SKB84240.1 tripartite ATP-independent transporter solute receptor, DctP family [Bosea thiooxidans]
MPITRRRFAAGLIAAPALLRAGSAGAASRPVTVASLLGEDKPETRIWRRIAEILARTAPGRFDLRIVSNAALGGEKEVAEGLRLGSIQAALSTVSSLSAWVPDGQILDLPFLFRDREHLGRVLAGPLGAELKARYAAQGFVVPGFINYGARHLLAKEPLTTPASVKGKRIRVIQSPLHTALWSGFGAYPTPIPIPETYNALKTGVVDCMDLTKSAYVGFRLHEVVPVLIETGHIWATGVVMFAAPFWKALTPADREALAAAAVEGAAYFDALMLADEAASMAKAASEGGRTVPAEDRAGWQDGARKVWASFAPQLGGIDRIEAIARSA